MAEIAVVLFLQLMDIRDLTQTLWMTHVMIGLAVLYFIYTICNRFYHHTTTHALWICHLISCLRKEEAVYNASSRNIHLQIACGYAVFDSRTDADLDALQKRADQNMYENKKQLKTFAESTDDVIKNNVIANEYFFPRNLLEIRNIRFIIPNVVKSPAK